MSNHVYVRGGERSLTAVLLVLASLIGCSAIEGLSPDPSAKAAVERGSPVAGYSSRLFRTADGSLVLEVPHDEFEFDPVEGQFKLGANAQRVLLPLGRPDSERFIGLERQLTVEQYLATIDGWVDAQVKDYAQKDVLTVDGSEIGKGLARGAEHRFGLRVGEDIQSVGLPDLPGRTLTAIPAPYRLVIGLYVGAAGVTFIAFSIAATATGAVVVAPPLFIAGTSLAGVGSSLILSVVYSEGQAAVFARDVQKIKAILHDAARRSPRASPLGTTFFDAKGFGYAAGLALPGNVSRVFPLGDDRVLIEDVSGTLFEVRYGDLHVRRIRAGPQRLQWVAERGDQVVLGFGLRDVVIMDRGSLTERRRWLVPRSLGHDRVRFRYLSRAGMVLQDQAGHVFVDPLTGEDARRVNEIHQPIYWMTDDGDRLVARVGERDFIRWNPATARVDRVRTLEGWKTGRREPSVSSERPDGGEGAWSWFHRPPGALMERAPRSAP